MSNSPKSKPARKASAPKAPRKAAPEAPRNTAPEAPRNAALEAAPEISPEIPPEIPQKAAPPAAKPFALAVNAEFQKKALRFMADLPALLLPSSRPRNGGPGPDAALASATDAAINAALAQTGELLGVSRVYVMLDEEGGRYQRNTHEWVDGKIGPAMYSWPLYDLEKDLPSLKLLMANRDFFSAHTRDTPPDLKRVLTMQAVDSVLLVPLTREGERIGIMGFDSCGRERDWREEEIAILRALARLVAVALERRGWQAAQGRLERIRAVLGEGDADAAGGMSGAGRQRKDVPQVPENPESLQAAERRLILETLARYQGNRLRAAKHLGLAWAALDRRCKKLGIEVKKS